MITTKFQNPKFKIQNLKSLLEESPYQAYVYSYPHKTAYRPLNPPISLADLCLKQDKRIAISLHPHSFLRNALRVL